VRQTRLKTSVENDKIYSSKKELLAFLSIKENFLYPDFSTKYKEKEIPKKNGDVRKIKPPNFNLKKVQRKILDKILCKSIQLSCVYGLSKNKGIVANAKTHEKNINAYFLLLDIENFFPTISDKDIAKIFKKMGFNKENSLILTKLCTIDNSLPQGAPTSPYLASLVCFKLDKEIYFYCKRRGLIYTRYFDDISISGKNILPEYISYIEKIICKHNFKCNDKKKNFCDCTTSKIINNILITKSGLSVSDNYKNDLKALYKKLLGDNSLSNQRVFAGKFGFYLHVNKKEAQGFLEQLKRKTSGEE
jgi:RNA-directed DNA polymerase